VKGVNTDKREDCHPHTKTIPEAEEQQCQFETTPLQSERKEEKATWEQENDLERTFKGLKISPLQVVKSHFKLLSLQNARTRFSVNSI